MRRSVLFICALLILTGLGASSAIAQSGSVNIGVNANLQQGLNLLAINTVEFGTVIIGSGPGTVILDEDTGEISIGGGALQPPEAGTFHPGEIRFTAPVDGLVSIFPVNPEVSLVGNQSGRGNVRFSPSVSVSTASVTAGETVSIVVGGSINFGNNTPRDSYAGSFEITVIYT